ncbi:glycosyltransferase family 4 protein [uncultured Eudoraea sp.]|uniref:glycosyltransferase family 4 protein n=1 Tax=uncultured Eudoraea sp. TaxID=1035614 RepID=UPI00263511A7|nr:glycosyltransferase family 4 protein [uncultured Eudoraea sp.]
MKVILVGDYPKDDKIQTGVQGVLVSLTDELLRHDEIDLIIVSLSEGTFLEKYHGKCTIRKVNLRSSILKARREFRSIVLDEDPDIIHLQGVVPGCLLYSRKFKDMFVVTQHAILRKERLWQVSLFRKIKFFIKGIVERYYLSKIQNIIFISDYNKELYKRGLNTHISVYHATIPNPVNRLFETGEQNTKSPWNSELYFVGELKKRKGLHVLIQALAQLKEGNYNFKLHVIGGFKEMAYKKYINALIEEKELAAEIHFCGWKDTSEIITYTKEIPIFVLPSFQETLPLSVAEAMTLGKLVIASDVGGTDEMIKDGRSGYLFKPGDFEGLTEILSVVFNNMEAQKVLMSAAKKESSKYSIETIVEQTLNFYRTII